MIFQLALMLASTAQSCAVPPAERQRQLALTYEAFDSAPKPYGWRALNASGCTDAAVALLKSYLQANRLKLTAEERREMPFHIGQVFAFGGRDADAAPYFIQADSPDAPEEWRAFVAAHIAFFRHDRSLLEQARARYAALAKSGSMRLKVIDGFLACPTKSYMEAAHCAM